MVKFIQLLKVKEYLRSGKQNDRTTLRVLPRMGEPGGVSLGLRRGSPRVCGVLPRGEEIKRSVK